MLSQCTPCLLDSKDGTVLSLSCTGIAAFRTLARPPIPVLHQITRGTQVSVNMKQTSISPFLFLLSLRIGDCLNQCCSRRVDSVRKIVAHRVMCTADLVRYRRSPSIREIRGQMRSNKYVDVGVTPWHAEKEVPHPALIVCDSFEHDRRHLLFYGELHRPAFWADLPAPVHAIQSAKHSRKPLSSPIRSKSDDRSWVDGP